MTRPLRILLWHVHGSWTTAFVGGSHEYLIPQLPDLGPDGRGLARTWDWSATARAVTPEQLRAEDIDLVVLQRPHEIDLVREWTGRAVGAELPAVYVEHNTPKPGVVDTVHPLAERSDVPIAHVTWFNRLYWDNGRAPATVIEHGVPDPGHQYTGDLRRIGVVINEPVRRARVVGTDLLPAFASAGPLDVFGMQVDGLGRHLGIDRPALVSHEDLPQSAMHAALAQRRVYVHPMRWTSLGLSLIEAMMLGMPVVALGATDAWEAVPQEAGVVSTDVDRLTAAARLFLEDAEAAALAGKAARAAALSRYGMDRFLRNWDRLLTEVTG
jgi:hypothetical protein